MIKKKEFFIYTGMWLVAVLLIVVLLWQNVGNARIINYSGIVRGATQKLVKEELNGVEDDEAIARLDGIIYDLETGKGDYGLNKNTDKDYRKLLFQLKEIWEKIKEEISIFRSQPAEAKQLYELSQRHFEVADRLVECAEVNSNAKLVRFIIVYFCSLLFSITIFTVLNMRSRQAFIKSIYKDNLTGISNRTGFEAEAAEMLRQHASEEYTIVELDINNFKSINNFYGYVMGDKLLLDLSSALSEWGGKNKLCARINADDFVLLAKHSETLMIEIQEMLAGVIRAQTFLETFGGISFTIGAYRIENNNELIKTVMDKANSAHKTAKAKNRPQPVWYDEKLLKKLEMEERLNERMCHALLAEEFKMYLQPKVELADMSLMGAEALVRWEDPERGTLYPDSFIPLFEKNGSIVDLDFYMLKKACTYLQNRLEKEPALPFVLSVNFSRVTLSQRDFYGAFNEIIGTYSLPHGALEVEVTESAFNELSDSVIQTLFRLQDEGFLISMDDFGAGYSSLNMLSKLPIQIIKMDREFLNKMDGNQKVRGIIASSVELAHSMGGKIICEGVEEESQAEFLREIGCDYAQGYFFSRPVPAEKFDGIKL